MAIHGYKGGVISATPPTTSVSGASGVWTVDDALQAGANWPVAPALSTNSVRTRASASAYMTRTPSVAGNQKTWTWSGWVKRGALSGNGTLFYAGPYTSSAYASFRIRFQSDALAVWNYSSGYNLQAVSTSVYRDPSAWYHIVVAVDTTSATSTITGSSTDRVRLYVNGVQLNSFSATTVPAQNLDTQINTTNAHLIANDGDNYYFDGYLTEINFIDGQALTPNYFGATDYATGVWQPATYRGTYGTNGFYLPMNVGQDGIPVDYLVVAGGGGGGNSGGGGGAGGMVTGTAILTASTVYTITVGSGGTGGQQNYLSGSQGSNSQLGSLTASVGGGYGGGDGLNGGNGGSGGGGGEQQSTNVTTGGSPTSGQGNSGGGHTSSSTDYSAGGGGGAGASGGNNSGNTSGNGGVGVASSITGSSVYYAGGGGGGGARTSQGGVAGTGGNGGGGNGSATGVGSAGTANLGGGGGGGGTGNYNGGNGGSGVVILRMLTSEYSGVTTGSPTVTTDGSYTVVKYTSSGSYTA